MTKIFILKTNAEFKVTVPATFNEHALVSNYHPRKK